MIEVRRIARGEGPLYRELRLRALADAPEAFCTTHAEAVALTDVDWEARAELGADGTERAIFLAFDGDSPIGLAALLRHEEIPDTGELVQVWIAPAHRGTRAAATLMNALLRWGVEEANFRRVIAEVRIANGRAISFYQRLGFENAREIPPRADDEIVLLWDGELVCTV